MTDFKARSALKKTIRSFFESKGYLEVDTPVIVPTPGTENYLRYFGTQWEDFKGNKSDLWLRSSPELHMKQIASLGFDKIFQIGPSFRNVGEFGDWHNPEFTMLEWYNKHQSFDEFIANTEDLILESFQKVRKDLGIEQKEISFTRISVYEAFNKYLGIDLIDNDPDLPHKLEKKLNSITENDDFESAFFKAILEKIEPEFCKLDAVSFYDYPPSQAALSKIEGGKSKRIETYLFGNEISNGFLELLDPLENKERILHTAKFRSEMGFEVPGEDTHFYTAMKHLNDENISMCGNALGFDRLLAVILGHEGISRVVPFYSQIFHTSH